MKHTYVSPKSYLYTIMHDAMHTLCIARFPQYITDSDSLSFEVEAKQIASFGDYSSNAAFALARIVKEHPSELAQLLAQTIREKNDPALERVEIAGGGFLNFFLTPSFLYTTLSRMQIVAQRPIKSKRVIIEFSSPNVAKPMHVGHLRATILGDFLSRLYTHQGYTVIAWNHLGDWGTQFGKLLVAYKRWGHKDIVEKNPIAELLTLYILFHDKVKEDPSLEDAAREEFKKLEMGDVQNRALWKWIVTVSLDEFKKTYALLNISFTHIVGESFYEPLLAPFLEKLQAEGIAQQSEGAWIIPLQQEGLPPALIAKSDGATLYMTRDIVSLSYRIKKEHPIKILYVVGNEQQLHFKQLFALNTLLHITDIPLEHVGFGAVLDTTGKKFATREGRIVSAQDLIDQVIAAARAVVSEKQQHIAAQKKERIATTVGIGSLKYNLLKDNRTSDIIFDPQRMLSLGGNSFSYVQYTYARLARILKKTTRIVRGRPNSLDERDWDMIKIILQFDDALTVCMDTSSAHQLTDYLFLLANKINAFYEVTPVLSDDNAGRKAARLYVLRKAAHVLATGLELLGTTPLDQI